MSWHLGPQPPLDVFLRGVKLPGELRDKIAQTARAAVRESRERHYPDERPRANKEQVKAFIEEIERQASLFVALRGRWAAGPRGRWPSAPTTRDEPSKNDIAKPLNAIAEALSAIERELNRLPTDEVIALDALTRLHCKVRAMGSEEWENHRGDSTDRLHHVLSGGSMDAYLPESADTLSLASILQALKGATAARLSHSNALPEHRQSNSGRDQFLRNIAQAFHDHLRIIPGTRQEPPSPFVQVLIDLFAYLNKEHGIPNPSQSTLYKLALTAQKTVFGDS